MSDSNLKDIADSNQFRPENTDPLSPGRTDLNPSDEAGIDELPHNEVDAPSDESTNPYEKGVPDIDPNNAEMDDQPNPR
ncbi:hypothetical protein [Pseudomonas sp. PvP001]|uniref:hypothetical protein n=1 Tax=Pseudomonas sp. PvP001 TaxID=3158559 RepID=UPI0033969E48